MTSVDQIRHAIADQIGDLGGDHHDLGSVAMSAARPTPVVLDDGGDVQRLVRLEHRFGFRNLTMLRSHESMRA
jgi:hypothetical protein